MAQHLAWSYSRYKIYEECPGKLWHCSVAPRGSPDRAPYVESRPQREGKEIDAALTARISKGTPLASKFAGYEDIAQLVLAQDGAKLTQVEWALDKTFAPCGSKDWNNAWVRVVIDLAIIQRSYAAFWDWKNGKIWIDENQLKLNAAVGFMQLPELEVIDTAYVWLRHDTISPKVYYRRDLPEMWHSFLPTVERMQLSYINNHWPKTPSPRACGYCDANKAGICKEAVVKYKGEL